MNKCNLFIGPLPPPLGGVAIINQSFQALRYDGYENVAFDTSNKKEREDLYSGIPFKSIGREFRKFQSLKKFIDRHDPAIAQVFVTSGYSIFRDIFYLKLLNKKNVPVIVHFHSKKSGEFALKENRLEIVASYFKKYAKKIVLLSNSHYQYFTQYFNADQCEVIENFVDYDSFENKIEEKSESLLYVGRLSEEKGFFDLLEACKKLKNNKIDYKLNVLGEAPNASLDRKIKNFVRLNELESNVVFHGLKYGVEKNDWFKKSKILVFPSHFENSPVVLKEAIAAKMAIISSDIDENKSILIGKNNCSFYETKNSNDLAETIENLIKDPSLIKKFCRASELIKDYDKNNANRKLKQLMEEVSC